MNGTANLTLAQKIAQRFQELGIDQYTLAKKRGVTQPAISLVLTGKTAMSKSFEDDCYELIDKAMKEELDREKRRQALLDDCPKEAA